VNEVMSDLKAGQIVTSKIDLIDDACGDHPALIYAKAGDKLTIVSEGRRAPGLIVKNNERDEGTFYCQYDEVQLVPSSD